MKTARKLLWQLILKVQTVFHLLSKAWIFFALRLILIKVQIHKTWGRDWTRFQRAKLKSLKRLWEDVCFAGKKVDDGGCGGGCWVRMCDQTRRRKKFRNFIKTEEVNVDVEFRLRRRRRRRRQLPGNATYGWTMTIHTPICKFWGARENLRCDVGS